MDLLATVNRWFGQADLRPTAEDIALRCRNEVWQLVHNRAGGMSSSEARGYIRIRAKQVVRHEVAVAIAGDANLRSTEKDALTHLALEHVMHQAHMDIMRRPHWQSIRKAA